MSQKIISIQSPSMKLFVCNLSSIKSVTWQYLRLTLGIFLCDGGKYPVLSPPPPLLPLDWAREGKPLGCCCCWDRGGPKLLLLLPTSYVDVWNVQLSKCWWNLKTQQSNSAECECMDIPAVCIMWENLHQGQVKSMFIICCRSNKHQTSHGARHHVTIEVSHVKKKWWGVNVRSI